MTRLLGDEMAKQFGPGGFRGGGATWHYHIERNMAEVQRRGRWKSGSFLEHYIQISAGLRAGLQWAEEVNSRRDFWGAPYAAFLWTHCQLG